MTCEGTESLVGEPFEEMAARIPVHRRGDLPGAGNFQFANFHATAHALRSGLPRRLSTDATTIRLRDTSQWWHAALPRSRYVLAPNIIRHTAWTGRWRNANRGRRDR